MLIRYGGTAVAMNKPAIDIDCKHIYSLYSHQVDVSFSILDKIKGAFKISAQKIGEVNSWTTFALAELYSDCSIYRATGDDGDKAQFRKTQKDLRDWLEEMAKILAPYKQIFDDVDKGKPTDENTKKTVKNAVDKGLDNGIAKGKKTPAAPAHKGKLVDSNILDLLNELQTTLPDMP